MALQYFIQDWSSWSDILTDTVQLIECPTMNVQINVCTIINITIIIILCIYLCRSFIPSILHIPNTIMPIIPTPLQSNLEGPTICKCMHYLLLTSLLLAVCIYHCSFMFHLSSHYISTGILPIKCLLQIIPQSTYVASYLARYIHTYTKICCFNVQCNDLHNRIQVVNGRTLAIISQQSSSTANITHK